MGKRLLLPEATCSVPQAASDFHVKVGEPMEEACYLDAARLVHVGPAAGLVDDARRALWRFSGPASDG